MTQEIWKYPLELLAENTIQAPVGFAVCAFMMQHGRPTVWLRVAPSAPIRPAKFVIVGTGHKFDHSFKYCGSVQDGDFVWHLMYDDLAFVELEDE